MVRKAGRGREIQWRVVAPRLHKVPKVVPLKLPLEMVTRAEWAAAPWVPQDNDVRLTFPIRHIRYTFTDTDEVYSIEEGIPLMQRLQRENQENGYPDIMYNYLIDSNGILYEGRGLDWKCTVFHDPWVNSPGESINVAYIGRFHDVQAPPKFRYTSNLLQKWLVRHCLMHEQFEITPSMCWGDELLITPKWLRTSQGTDPNAEPNLNQDMPEDAVEDGIEDGVDIFNEEGDAEEVEDVEVVDEE